MLLCSKWKNGLCKIVTKSQVVTKVNVTKSRLHCTTLLTFKLQLYLWSSKNICILFSIFSETEREMKRKNDLEVSNYFALVNS